MSKTIWKLYHLHTGELIKEFNSEEEFQDYILLNLHPSLLKNTRLHVIEIEDKK